MLETTKLELDEVKQLKNIKIDDIKIEISRKLKLMRREIKLFAEICGKMKYTINGKITEYEKCETDAYLGLDLDEDLAEKLSIFEALINRKKEEITIDLRYVLRNLQLIDNMMTGDRFIVDTKHAADDC